MSVIKLDCGIELPYPDKARGVFTRPSGISERRWKEMKPDMWHRAYTHCLYTMLNHIEDPMHSAVPAMARKMLEASEPMKVALRFLGEMTQLKYIKLHTRPQKGGKGVLERVILPYKKLTKLDFYSNDKPTTAITMPHIVGSGRVPTNFVVRNGVSSRKNRKVARVVIDIAKESFAVNQYILRVMELVPPDTVSDKEFKSYYMLNRSLASARALVGKVFTYPYYFCSRSRVYQGTTCGISPQGSDSEKSLIQPTYHETLTSSGYRALIEVAEGYSEQSWPPETMAEHARNPQKYVDVWKDADKPYMYMATANLIRMYLDNPEQPLPAFSPLDGRCSGLQHWSAVVRSNSITRHLGMHEEESSEDIYERAAREWGETLPEAYRKYATRKAAKIPVMTWGYNATQMTAIEHMDKLFGALKEWDSQKECYIIAGEGLTRAETAALGGDLYKRLNETLKDLSGAVRWISDAATIISKAGNTDIHWLTPDKFECKQRKVLGVRKDLKVTLDSREELELQILDFSGNLPDHRKNRSAIAPNIIHSLDATHLRMVANRLAAMGLPMIFIHDSFSTHVNYRDELYKIIVEEFVKLYSGNYLLDLALYWTSRYKVDIGLPPKMGDWEPKTLLKLDKFFI